MFAFYFPRNMGYGWASRNGRVYFDRDFLPAGGSPRGVTCGVPRSSLFGFSPRLFLVFFDISIQFGRGGDNFGGVPLLVRGSAATDARRAWIKFKRLSVRYDDRVCRQCRLKSVPQCSVTKVCRSSSLCGCAPSDYQVSQTRACIGLLRNGVGSG